MRVPFFPHWQARRCLTLTILVLTALVTVSLGLTTPLFRSQAAPQNQNKKNRHIAHESVPGEILVRFREDARAAKTTPSEVQLSVNGRQVDVQLEYLAPRTELVKGLRLARVSAADTALA